jgi:hypothetical protein
MTDKTVDFNRSDIVVIDRKKKIALAIEKAVPLIHNFSRQRKLQSMKIWPWK